MLGTWEYDGGSSTGFLLPSVAWIGADELPMGSVRIRCYLEGRCSSWNASIERAAAGEGMVPFHRSVGRQVANFLTIYG